MTDADTKMEVGASGEQECADRKPTDQQPQQQEAEAGASLSVSVCVQQIAVFCAALRCDGCPSQPCSVGLSCRRC
jgi:hypothetical protein